MRKVVLSMLLVAVSVLVSAAQDMISFHVEVDDASHVLASETYYDSALGYAESRYQVPGKTFMDFVTHR